jgi:hypothetical protein
LPQWLGWGCFLLSCGGTGRIRSAGVWWFFDGFLHVISWVGSRPGRRTARDFGHVAGTEAGLAMRKLGSLPNSPNVSVVSIANDNLL